MHTSMFQSTIENFKVRNYVFYLMGQKVKTSKKVHFYSAKKVAGTFDAQLVKHHTITHFNFLKYSFEPLSG